MDSTNLDPSKQVWQVVPQDPVSLDPVVVHGSGVDVDHRVGCAAVSTLAQGQAGQASSESSLSDDELSQRFVFNMMKKEIDLATIALGMTFLDENTGEDADEVDENGDTGLMRALYSRNTEALKIYCQIGSLYMKRDSNGFTPLMLAARQGYAQAVEILLEHGAGSYINDVDDHGMMAIDYLEMSSAFMFQRDSFDLPKVILRELLIRRICQIRNITPQLYEKVHEEWKEWKSAQQGLDDVDFTQRILGVPHRIKPRNVYKWAYDHILANQKMNPQADQYINRDLTIQDIKNFLEFCSIHSLNGVIINNEPLFCAIQADRPDIVSILLKAGANIEAPDSRGFRPLMLAAMNGQINILKILLKAGANRNTQDHKGRSALMLATMCNQHEAMKILLADPATNKELRDDDSNTALLIALRYQSPDNIELSDQTVNLLLDYCVNAEHQGYGNTTLMLAIQRRYPTATERLLLFYRDKGELEARNCLGDTGFIWAVCCNNLHAAHYLLESGANIEARNNDGNTGLMRAAEGNHVELINLMLTPPRSVPSQAANIEARNNKGETALIVAAKNCKQEALERLLEAGANIEAASTDGITALVYAINAGNISMIRCLIQHGVNVNRIHPKTGLTYILFAQKCEHRLFESSYPRSYPTGIPQLLMDAGAADPESSEIVRKWVSGQWEANNDWVLDPELTFDEVLEMARQDT